MLFLHLAGKFRPGGVEFLLKFCKGYCHCYRLSSFRHRLRHLPDTRRTTQRGWSVGPALIGQAGGEKIPLDVPLSISQYLFLPQELVTGCLIINVGAVEKFVYAAGKLYYTVQSRFSEPQFLDATLLPI